MLIHRLLQKILNPEPYPELQNLPWNCRTCELLGLCRDEDNHWKCYHGCLIMNHHQLK